MVPMKGVHKFGSARCFWHPMKNKAMGDIFKECPEKHTSKENQQDGAGAVIVLSGCQVNDIGQDRDIHSPDYQWMGLGQCFQEITLEKPGLPLIMYFFEMHGAKIRSGKLQEIIRQILYSF